MMHFEAVGMKVLDIEWLRFETGGETCLRCLETCKTLDLVIAYLNHELKSKGLEVSFKAIGLM
jgi:hypothetical protein